MKSQPFWQSNEFWTTLIGAAVGFLAATAKESWDRHKRQRVHWAALRAEITYCNQIAVTYLNDKIAAPSYRLPTVAYSQSLPGLLADGRLAEHETRSLLEFFTQVDSLNRGLDLAQAARGNPDKSVLEKEYERNLLKARGLLRGDEDRKTYYDSALEIIDVHL